MPQPGGVIIPEGDLPPVHHTAGMTPAREIILAMLEKYRAAGIDEIRDPRGFRPSPFFEMGQAPGVGAEFGTVECSGG